MKATRNTFEQLIVEDPPWQTGLGIGTLFLFFTGAGLLSVLDGELGGLVFFVGSAIGALAFWAFVRRLMVIFNRDNDTIEIRRPGTCGSSHSKRVPGRISP
ncbi:hypothetical protein [Celeribacter sp.]|uniref:hypothetical protein n=1 Tax=Celeribacter sp. TaxID=1890673 RepID=UPI003A8DD7E5